MSYVFNDVEIQQIILAIQQSSGLIYNPNRLCCINLFLKPSLAI